MARVLIISLLLYSLNFFLGLANVFGNPGRNGHVFVKKVKLAGNLILDDIAFKKSLDMGSGIYLTHDLMSLITNEIEGFYSSHGFHQVFVDYPFRKPRKGILTVDVDERKEIMEGQSEIQRAEIAIDRLLRESRLDSSVVSKKKCSVYLGRSL